MVNLVLSGVRHIDVFSHGLEIMTIDEAKKRFPPVWAIYDHPKDYPNHWVVRCWYGLVPEIGAMLCSSLEEARELVPKDAIKLGTLPGEDPAIAETWI